MAVGGPAMNKNEECPFKNEGTVACDARRGLPNRGGRW